MVPEVDHEQLVALAEIADDVGDFLRWIVKHFGHRADAEIEAVVRTGGDFDEPLEALDGSQHAFDSLVALLGHARIMRMAGHPDFVVGGDRDHALQKVT